MLYLTNFINQCGMTHDTIVFFRKYLSDANILKYNGQFFYKTYVMSSI
jgi:hypothetical protein